jgi:hypothetical protein
VSGSLLTTRKGPALLHVKYVTALSEIGITVTDCLIPSLLGETDGEITWCGDRVVFVLVAVAIVLFTAAVAIGAGVFSA